MICLTLSSGRKVVIRGSTIRNMVQLNSNTHGVATSVYLTKDTTYEVVEPIETITRWIKEDRNDIDPRDIAYIAAQLMASRMPSRPDEVPQAVKFCVTLAERIFEEVGEP